MQRVSFKNSRGLNLVGNLYHIDTQKGVVIAHGFMGSKHGSGKYERLAQALNGVGFNVLSFDFSGCGESDDDSITVNKEVDDLKAAITFLRKNGSKDITLVGYSLGALVAVLAWDQSVSTMVLWAPAIYKKENPRNSYSPEELKELDASGFTTRKIKNGSRTQVVIGADLLEERRNVDQKRLLSHITSPVLIIQGEDDEKVTKKSSLSAISYLPPSSKLIIVPKGKHDITDDLSAYITATTEWIVTHA